MVKDDTLLVCVFPSVQERLSLGGDLVCPKVVVVEGGKAMLSK